MTKISVKKAIIIIISFSVIGFIILFSLIKKNPAETYTTQVVEKVRIVQTVSETGTIKPIKELNLNFLSQGTIAKLNFKIGDNVNEGDIIAELDQTGLIIQKNQAQAQLDIAKANLQKLVAGLTLSELAVKQAAVNQAKIAYESALNEQEKTIKSQAEIVKQAEKSLNDLLSSYESNNTTYEQAVQTAKTSLNNTKLTYQLAIDDKVSSGITTVESQNAVAKAALDAVKKLLDDDSSDNYLSVKDTSYLQKTNSTYDEAVLLLMDADNSLLIAKNSKDYNDINVSLTTSLNALNKSFTCLSNSFSALENSIVSSQFTQTNVDTYKSTISSQRTLLASGISAVQLADQGLNSAILNYNNNVDTATENLAQAEASLENARLSAENQLANAKNTRDQQTTLAMSKVDSTLKAYEAAQAELARSTAPARNEDVRLAQGQVKQAEAQLDTILNNIENSLLKAPITGKITKINFEVGEQYQASKPMVSLLGENNLEIEVDISEADITKIKLDDYTKITLDALGEDQVFKGSVIFIEPAETIIQDVIYYKIKIAFDEDQNLSLIKPGMTANIEVTTAEKSDVLTVPLRAIIDKNGDGKFVRVVGGETYNEVKVVTGILADSGQIEILSGLSEGETVVVSIKQN